MCGRYVAYTDAEYTEMSNIVHDVQSRLSDHQLKTGEIFPTNLAPVITVAGAVPMAWGFQRWDGGGVVINARAETAAEKRMFREALFTRRLVVPSTGFFEWKRTEGKKQKDKYLIRLPGESMLYMAGLYTLYQRPDGSREGRFVILTTAANDSMAPLHDRMPVILGTQETGEWLTDGERAGQILARPGPELMLERVS